MIIVLDYRLLLFLCFIFLVNVRTSHYCWQLSFCFFFEQNISSKIHEESHQPIYYFNSYLNLLKNLLFSVLKVYFFFVLLESKEIKCVQQKKLNKFKEETHILKSKRKQFLGKCKQHCTNVQRVVKEYQIKFLKDT